MTQHEALFETPAAHQAVHYSHPYSHPESHYSHPEFEWEMHETSHYSNPEAHPYSHPYSHPEMEYEWETHEASPYSNPYSHPEMEYEWEYQSDRFIGGLLKRGFKWLRNRVKSLARPVFRAVTSMIPGVGAITRAIAQEGEMEAMQMEAEFFGTNEAEAEIGHSQAAQEAALTELLAAQAAESASESQAEAILAATLPIAITIMDARSLLRPVMPIMTQANARLVNALGQDPYRRQLRRLVPTMQRQAIATLRAAASSGQPITGSQAVRALATSAARVLSNPRRVGQVLRRNEMLRRMTPPHPRRTGVYAPSRPTPYNPRRTATQPIGVTRCPTCAARLQTARRRAQPIG